MNGHFLHCSPLRGFLPKLFGERQAYTAKSCWAMRLLGQGRVVSILAEISRMACGRNENARAQGRRKTPSRKILWIEIALAGLVAQAHQAVQQHVRARRAVFP